MKTRIQMIDAQAQTRVTILAASNRLMIGDQLLEFANSTEATRMLIWLEQVIRDNNRTRPQHLVDCAEIYHDDKPHDQHYDNK